MGWGGLPSEALLRPVALQGGLADGSEEQGPEGSSGDPRGTVFIRGAYGWNAQVLGKSART